MLICECDILLNMRSDFYCDITHKLVETKTAHIKTDIDICTFIGALGMSKAMMQDLLNAFPGIDEAMSYSEVMK